MEGLDHTKLRLIREAIEHNVETARRPPTRARARGWRPGARWLGGMLLLVVNLAYLFVPRAVVSRNAGGTADVPTPVSRSEFDPIMWPLGPTPPLTQAVIDTPAPVPEVLPFPPRALPRTLFQLAVKRVVIDPGHGGDNLGAIAESGVLEKEITLDIALRLRRLMEGTPFTVLMTRQTDRTMSLGERVAFANENNADLFVSIHLNWIDVRGLRPLEVYHVGPTEDPVAMRLARLENRDSGYSLSDYHRLLDQVFIDARRDESRRLAKSVHARLARALSDVHPTLDDRGVKMAPFVVLAGTQMPAILAEVSCLSNADEVKRLLSAEYRETIASALLGGIRTYAGTFTGPEETRR
jgi:N-acetylmuramoyl-L-alanine amidase